MGGVKKLSLKPFLLSRKLKLKVRKLVNMLNITYLYNEETSQKDQVVTASTPSKPLLT